MNRINGFLACCMYTGNTFGHLFTPKKKILFATKLKKYYITQKKYRKIINKSIKKIVLMAGKQLYDITFTRFLCFLQTNWAPEPININGNREQVKVGNLLVVYYIAIEKDIE